MMENKRNKLRINLGGPKMSKSVIKCKKKKQKKNKATKQMKKQPKNKKIKNKETNNTKKQTKQTEKPKQLINTRFFCSENS